MTDPLRLTVTDDAVWRLTYDAVAVTVGHKPHLTLRCRTCGTPIAHASRTAHGPVFISSWEVERPLQRTVYVNGRKLTRRETLRFEEQLFEPVLESGPPVNAAERDSTMALLAVPETMPQEYPDLLVRCNDHGDAVVDRTQVLSWLRRGISQRKLDLRMPHLEYDRGRIGGGQIRKSNVTRRFRPPR